MKKMHYLIIFLIVLILVVFVGCVKFSNDLGGETTTEESVSEYDVESEASELASEIAAQMESVTDEAGSTVFSQEQISEYISQEMTPRTPTTAAPSAGNNGATQPSGSGATQPANNGGSSTSAAKQTQSGNNKTTQAPTQAPTQQQQQQQQQQPAGVNEYDILRSGNFYATGSMKDTDGTNQPLEIAITPSSIYMLTKMEGVDMAMLQQNGDLYMIYPAKQMYMEMSSVIMGMMGMSSDELLSVSELGFSDMRDLSEADTVADGEYAGQSCKIYSFNKSTGNRTVVYMNGNKLLGFEDVSSSGTASTTITSITANVPAEKCAPPANYKKANMISFMNAMKDVIG